jgi:protein O-mannosyl-transferase
MGNSIKLRCKIFAMSKQKKQATPQKAPQKVQGPSTKPSNMQLWWFAGVALLILIVTRLAYQPALDNQFVEWDDQLYVTENPMVFNAGKPGTPPVWKTPIALNYHPLTMETMVMNAKSAQIKPGQLSPKPFISTNIYLHTLNGVLVFLFVWFLTKGNFFASLFSGLIFALHPMHVESVAWVSGRKDVLYTAFFLMACITYLRYIDQRKTAWLAATFALFILSCLSKAMAVSLVPVLLLLDWWRDRSFRSAGVWLEKVPFFAAALFFGLLAIDIQSGGNFHGMFPGIEGVKTATAGDKFAIIESGQFAAYGMLQYLIKFVAPSNMSPFYPYPIESLLHQPLPAIFPASVLILLLLAGLAIWSARHTKIALFGFAFFLFTVVLVSQFASVGIVIMADRYTYIPYIGLGIALLLGLHHFMKTEALKYGAWAVMSIACLAFAVKTSSQVDVWDNSAVLWQTAAKYAPNDGYIMANLGNYYGKNGKLDEAAACFEKAIQNKTANANVFEGMGNVYGSRNDHRKAAEMFTEAIKLDPRKGNYYFNRGTAYTNFDPARAIEDFNTALPLLPTAKKVEVLSNRAFCYLKMEQYDKALADYSAIIDAGNPREKDYFDRGVVRSRQNDIPGAIKDLEAALRINPNFEQAKNGLQQLRSAQR